VSIVRPTERGEDEAELLNGSLCHKDLIGLSSFEEPPAEYAENCVSRGDFVAEVRSIVKLVRNEIFVNLYIQVRSCKGYLFPAGLDHCLQIVPGIGQED